ncbi:tetratricopeptide repeat protein [Streptomyces sp. NPDC028722]|uniref:tetratricopeptide repeat protein n=1 Tax=Streptomyces sp. NPDC028722 TaxID=3155016 RepID=UPI0033EC08A9
MVWLNEAQHYLGHPRVGERIAAALHTLLTHTDRGPVLVLGTLWPTYADTYTGLAAPGGSDPHSRVRELLTGRTLTVPDAFDEQALQAASTLARDGDRLLADALARAHTHGQVTQDLAGAPELVRRYEQGSPPVRALLEAAMDARRLGVGLHLPQAFLIDAATDYLTDDDYDQLTEEWAEAAFAALARPVHGRQAPLRRTAIRPPRIPPSSTDPTKTPLAVSGALFKLADYLEQYGQATRRRLCPPASFWHAAHAHLTDPDRLHRLAIAADCRQRLQWAYHLWRKAAETGHPYAQPPLVWDRERAETMARQAADTGDARVMKNLGRMREEAGDREGAEALYRQAADTGDVIALNRLGRMHEEAGDGEGAEALYRQAADTGDGVALNRLGRIREQAGDREGAEALYRQAADTGSPVALADLARMREEAGDRESAEVLARQASAAGYTLALKILAVMREEAGDWEGAEVLHRYGVDAGYPHAVADLALLREKAGDREGAEVLARQAADSGSTDGLERLALMREEAGDQEGAEMLVWQAADAGYPLALVKLAQMRQLAGDQEGAEVLARRADAEGVGRNRGRGDLLIRMELRECAGDREGAETLAWQAVDTGHPHALITLAKLREKAGDQEGAETLYRQAADVGEFPLGPEGRWLPYGLDPDGSPTPPWF